MPTIPPQEHQPYQEWLYLEGDGDLSRSQRAALDLHLESCAGCREDRKRIARLGTLLEEATVEADPALYERVMESLPAAGWEARHPRTWGLAAAAFAFVAAAAALVGWSGGGLVSVGPLAGAVRAVADLFTMTALAGAGLLTASWQGLGLALGEVFGGSRITLGAFAVFVLGVDFLFVRYLLRRPGRALAEARRSRR